jgi:hypothetical protein
MATSGTITFNQDRDQIIGDAFAHLNIYAPSDTIEKSDLEFACNQLNKMVKAWQAQGNHLWKKKEATLFLGYNQNTYTLSSTGDHATNNFVSTTLNADAAQSATSLTVVSTTGMTVGDNIGIILNTGALQWTTIATIPTSTALTISVALTSAANTGNIIYTYTTRINRPLRIYSGRRNSSSDLDTPMLMYSYDEYFVFPSKTSTGQPTTCMYNPQLGAGLFYIWPTPIDLTDKVKFSYAEAIQDFNGATNNPDLPQEWLEVLAMQLAVRLSYRYGKRNLIAGLKADADAALQDLLAWDNEDVSIYFQPSRY